MSHQLPVVDGAKLIRVFERIGWKKLRQTGSHVRLERHGEHVPIPLHKPLRRGTLSALIDAAGISADRLRELL